MNWIHGEDFSYTCTHCPTHYPSILTEGPFHWEVFIRSGCYIKGQDQFSHAMSGCSSITRRDSPLEHAFWD